MTAPDSVVIIGAGHAGGTLAARLRQTGFEGEVTLIGAEPHPPYHRPPLSKGFGKDDEAVQWLFDDRFFADQRITFRPDTRVAALYASHNLVRTAENEMIPYDAAVVATGARPRRLNVPGSDGPSILALRTLDDARKLRSAVAAGGPIVIIGGGYVGLEVAAAARAQGVDVTVVEREERVLARVGSPTLSAALTRRHAERGITILTRVDVAAFERSGDTLTAVELRDGRRLPAAAAVVGVGASPRDELAELAGLARAPQGGILVDIAGRTDVAGVFAIGDVTVRPGVGGGAMRFESIPSAVEQARRVAEAIMGGGEPAVEHPWFWSDQFDLKLKSVGVLPADYQTVVRGRLDDSSFALYHHDGERLVAAECVNANADFMAAKRMLASAHRVDFARLADPTASLRDLVVT